MSSAFIVSNGRRQGGIMSPILFNVYIDDLNKASSACGIGCEIGDIMLNNLSYADDMCLAAPSIKGLRKLLKICQHFAEENDIVYNVLKTKCMCFKSRNKCGSVPPVTLSGHTIEFVSKFVYLGHVITPDLKDDDDIASQRRALCDRANLLLRKFGNCCLRVKIRLFNTFCNNIYCAQLWSDFNVSSIRSLHVCHNNALRRFLYVPRNASISAAFVENNVNNFPVFRRKCIYSLVRRLHCTDNSLLRILAMSDARYFGVQYRWRQLLYRAS